jgi:hypothetical protein
MRPQEPDFASVMASGGRYAAGAATQRCAAGVQRFSACAVHSICDAVRLRPVGLM